MRRNLLLRKENLLKNRVFLLDLGQYRSEHFRFLLTATKEIRLLL